MIVTAILRKLYTTLLFFCGYGSSSSPKANLEVERKFRITQEMYRDLPDKLNIANFHLSGTIDMIDLFLPAPNEGDMVRIRCEKQEGAQVFLLTLKQWADTGGGTKERNEIEDRLPNWLRLLLTCLGRQVKGSELLTFSKHRQLYVGRRGGLNTVVSLDLAVGLGKYSGTYMEIEILVPVGDDVAPARQGIFNLASQLLGKAAEPVTRSYMQMLTEESEPKPNQIG